MNFRLNALSKRESVFFSPSASILESKSHFATLFLPPPRINILGDSEWDYTDADLKKSFRDLSLRVHPDKCRSERASDAFRGKASDLQAVKKKCPP